jgi:hypothetical protein
MGRPTRIIVEPTCGVASVVGAASEAESQPPAGDYVDMASFDAAVNALDEARAGLGSAANQFAAMRESQEAGHFPEVHNNPEKFAEKADAAARALADLGFKPSDQGGQRCASADSEPSPAPASSGLAEDLRTTPGAGEGEPVCFGYPEHLAPPNGRGKTCQRCGRRIETSPAPATSDGAFTAEPVAGEEAPSPSNAGRTGVPTVPAASCPSWAQRFLPMSMRKDRD